MKRVVRRQPPLLVLSANPTYVCDNLCYNQHPDGLLRDYQDHYYGNHSPNSTPQSPQRLPQTPKRPPLTPNCHHSPHRPPQTPHSPTSPHSSNSPHSLSLSPTSTTYTSPTIMGSKASVQASIKEISHSGSSVHTRDKAASSMVKADRDGSQHRPPGGASVAPAPWRRLTLHDGNDPDQSEPEAGGASWAAMLEEKEQEIRNLREENAALQEENQQLRAELEELRSKQANERLSVSNELLSHSRLSISSGISSHSGRTDASGAFSASPLVPGSPWSTRNDLSPDPKRKSSTSRHARRHLVQMTDIEAYGKGLNPAQAHYIIRTPSVGTNSTKDSLEDDEINGNTGGKEDS